MLSRNLMQFSTKLNPWKVILRQKSYTPFNTVVMFVPQQEAWIVERMGKFSRILEPGLNVLIPVVDKVKYVQSLKEIAVDIPKQSAITSDNVTLSIDGVLYLRIIDAYKASYGVEDPEFAITQLAQTTMRSELGKISLDKVFRERENLNVQIVDSINKASEAWGMCCLRYEIRDIKLPNRVQEAMQTQVEAERRKRACILESEGKREAEINIAEGLKRSLILKSEAERQQQINKAEGEAIGIIKIAEAKAEGLRKVENVLREGREAAGLGVAEKYVEAFGGMINGGGTVVLGMDAGDVPKMVTQAMSIYNSVNKTNQRNLTKVKRISTPKIKDDLAEFFSDDEELKQHKEKLASESKLKATETEKLLEK